MGEGKYAKYVIPKQISKPEPWPSMEWVGDVDYQTDVSFIITQVREPCVMEEYPHSHDFDMYLHFFSYDPDNMNELPAEIEIGLGEEREMYTITSPTSVYIPKGMVHCPLIFKRVDKPIILFHTSIAPRYEKDPDKIIKE
ncbi:MAG: hypothetical protein N3B14_02290 [Thermoleophilia bacterium]|nr:hypothetical protein [Thermoleophilia bacterium]